MNFDKKIKLHKTLKRMQWRKTVKLPVSQLAEQAGINYNNGENTIAYFGALLF